MAILPWSIYASQRAGELVPVTQGSAAALFVGTYLPGDGTTVGLKRDLGDATRHRDERLHAIPDLQLEAAAVLDTVAARDPGRSRRAALNHEARRNLRRYGLGDPLAFAAMMSRKAGRMWVNYARGGPRHNSGAVQALHVVLVLTGLAGLLAGLWRRRDPVLGAILVVVVYSTLLHTLVVSQARYNLPLMPALVAGGVAGAVLAARSGSRSRSSR